MKKFNKLTIILPTEAPLFVVEKLGFINHWSSRFNEYKKFFYNIDLYSFDNKNYSYIFNIKHHPIPFLLNIKYVDHFIYNLFLLINAKRMSKIIRVFFTTYFIWGFVKKLFNKIIIVSFQYYYADTCKSDYGRLKGFAAKCLEKNTLLLGDIIFTTTEKLYKYILDHYNKKSLIVPEVVNRQLFKPYINKQNYFVYAGRLVQIKGIKFLIDTFKIFIEEYNQFYLYIIGGTTSEVTNYRNYIKENNIKNIIIIGSVNQQHLANILMKAKALILPTITSEGQPKILLETMSTGTVPIASDIRGNNDTIIDGYNGLLFPPNNKHALLEKMKLIINDNELYSKLYQNVLFTASQYDVKLVINNEMNFINSYITENEIHYN